MYVTLEPCHHTGRTPPCDKQLIKRNVKRVFVAVTDPDERVSGNGIKALKEAGKFSFFYCGRFLLEFFIF